MAFITVQEFKDYFSEYKDAEFPSLERFIDESTDKINYFTFDNIDQDLNYDDFLKDLIKKACLYATHFKLMIENFIEADGEKNVKSIKLGDLSISKTIIDQFVFDREDKNKIVREIGNDAHKYLMRSGFLNNKIPNGEVRPDLSRRVGND